MDLATIDRLKNIYWTVSDQDWLGHAYAEATKDLADIIAKHEPTIGPLGTPLVEVKPTPEQLMDAAVAFRDAEAEWDAVAPSGGTWAAQNIMDAAYDKKQKAFEALIAAALGVP